MVLAISVLSQMSKTICICLGLKGLRVKSNNQHQDVNSALKWLGIQVH